jgi:hypothetical protein
MMRYNASTQAAAWIQFGDNSIAIAPQTNYLFMQNYSHKSSFKKSKKLYNQDQIEQVNTLHCSDLYKRFRSSTFFKGGRGVSTWSW